MNFHPLPFYDERQFPIDTLLYHCSALHTQEMLHILEKNKLSCHYIIDTNGEITQVIPEEKRAWHGGLGSWREIKNDINSHSIGIELTSLDMGQTPYSKIQIEKLITLSKKIIQRYNIKPQNIIGHSDSAPTRKPDPGKAFPWEYLAKKGIGLWYDLNNSLNAPTTNLKKLLKGIGYETKNFAAAQYAFARHFMPELVEFDNNIEHLIDQIYPEKIDFNKNEKFINTAQAVYMSFNP